MIRMRLFAVILLLQAAIVLSPNLSIAQTSTSAALTGRVSSQEEGAMEGVLVSATKDGSTVTITVVSNAQGQYSFPRTKLEAGRYTLHIRAVGYDFIDPGPVEVTAQKAAQADLKLVKTKDLAAQLSNSEWLMSVPGTAEQKQLLMCSLGCHSIERIVRSYHTPAEFMQVLQRMRNYHPSSIPEAPQPLPPVAAGAPEGASEDGTLGSAARVVSQARADYLSTVNLSAVSVWQYPLKTLPRPKGKATRVIVTQYELPRRTTVPHDVTLDAEGKVWYCDMRQNFLGKLDPATGKVVEYRVPMLRPEAPPGCETVEFDRDGNPWISMDDQGAIGKFDRKTEKFQTFSIPPVKGVLGVPDGTLTRSTTVQAQSQAVDGKVWVQVPLGSSNHIYKWVIERLDVRTGQYEDPPIDVYRDLPADSPAQNRKQSIYHTFADPQNNLYFTDNDADFFGKIDAETRKVSFYRTPTPNSHPRRGHFDSQGRFWFGEDGVARIAMFDPKAGQIKEWPITTPYGGAYDVVMDKYGYAWTGSMQDDRVTRLNVKTGEMVEYLLPRFTNIRKVQVDDSKNPVSFWVADSNHDGTSTITRVEPIE